MTSKLSITGCEGEDVIAFSNAMYRVDQITSAFDRQANTISSHICNTLTQSDKISIPNAVFTTGFDCEVLGVNLKGWRKGRVVVKFELEFIPDEIEEVQEEEASASVDSSLDSLRAVPH